MADAQATALCVIRIGWRVSGISNFRLINAGDGGGLEQHLVPVHHHRWSPPLGARFGRREGSKRFPSLLLRQQCFPAVALPHPLETQ